MENSSSFSGILRDHGNGILAVRVSGGAGNIRGVALHDPGRSVSDLQVLYFPETAGNPGICAEGGSSGAGAASGAGKYP